MNDIEKECYDCGSTNTKIDGEYMVCLNCGGNYVYRDKFRSTE